MEWQPLFKGVECLLLQLDAAQMHGSGSPRKDGTTSRGKELLKLAIAFLNKFEVLMQGPSLKQCYQNTPSVPYLCNAILDKVPG